MALFKTVIALGFALAVSSVQGETTPSSGSTVRIKRIQPPIAEMLKPGQKVAFAVDLEYNLAADSGEVALIVQSAEGPLGHKFLKVTRGTGKVTLQVEVTVPTTSSVQIYTPIYHDRGGATSVVDGRVYEVAQ